VPGVYALCTDMSGRCLRRDDVGCGRELLAWTANRAEAPLEQRRRSWMWYHCSGRVQFNG
jgi:hypothetical protein